ELPFVKPTAYGMGKSGWVTVTLGPAESPPIALLKEWIDESYRAVAPKKLVAALAGEKAQTPGQRVAAGRRRT
ncbi:MAG TPA: MmcQ/YjbR family DNA-binding protein, partial [Polyangia bacterium]|nr:MmcQ/YjbR family DNA-binding protein [Polyangia bacterium]